jgi:hypothetical protein
MQKKRLRIILLVVLFIGLILYLAYRGFSGPPQITVVNNSASELTAVLLSGEGWSQQVTNISPRKSITAFVYPRSESGLHVSFISNGKRINKGDLEYIEPGEGYCVTITVDEDLMVSTSGTLGCFSFRRAIRI